MTHPDASHRWGFATGSERRKRYRDMFRIPKEEAEELEKTGRRVLKKEFEWGEMKNESN